MAGTEGGHNGGHDLLRQATQAMMSRYAQGYTCEPESSQGFLMLLLFSSMALFGNMPCTHESILEIFMVPKGLFRLSLHMLNIQPDFSTGANMQAPYRNPECPIGKQEFSHVPIHTFPFHPNHVIISYSSTCLHGILIYPLVSPPQIINLRISYNMALADHNHLQNRTGEDDGNDHIDSDTPRSGVATPRPDPSDKRLPGIMHSYFGQVGSGSSKNPPSGPLQTPALGSEAENPLPFHRRETPTDGLLQSNAPASQNESTGACCEDDETSLFLPHEQAEASRTSSAQPRGLHPYPTPPVSKPPSVQRLKLSHSNSEGEVNDKRRSSILPAPSSFSHSKSISASFPSKARRASMLYPLSAIVTASNVHATHFSTPPDLSPSTAPTTPIHSRFNSSLSVASLSYDRLKKLTDDAGLPRKKSNPPTPTRALSNQTAGSDTSAGSDPVNGRVAKTSAPVAEPAAGNTSNGASGAPVKSARGKLHVKIAEARGLRRSKDPYVVAVFQRNELVSKGPRIDEDDEDDEMKSPVGGIPMSRTGSESGRPMAIPMKSRQSSSTSLTEYRDFKIKARKSMTNPKWDTEAVL